MYNFKNDYDTGAHPTILKKLSETNFESQLGYGLDEYSLQAKKIIQQKIENPKAEIFLLSGGTQTNLIAISFLLRPYEAVVSAESGHIFANEAGAIEATGHKVITAQSKNGKLTPGYIENALKAHDFKPHIVKPRLVYISNSTEIGTIYTKQELVELYSFCQSKNLLLYLDGARLGHALTATNNDLTFAEIAKFTDAFYIGATKNGGLLGEALVFNKPELAEDFEYVLKQKGALLAKGRVLAIQFIALFEDLLYFDLAKHANEMASKMTSELSKMDFEFLTHSTTNQIFPILPISLVNKLNEKYLFHIWKQIDDENTAIRLVTSWSTEEKIVDKLINDIQHFTVKNYSL